MLIYASRTATRSLQFKVHGRLPVAGMAVSAVLMFCALNCLLAMLQWTVLIV